MPRIVTCCQGGTLRAAWCQGGTLRALISALVLVQCALILLYWDATRGGGNGAVTGSAHPLRLQAKASHLHAQMQGKLPEGAIKHFRENYDDATQTIVSVSGGVNMGGEGGGGGDGGGGEHHRKSWPGVDHKTDLQVETGKGELIRPDTALLLFKPSGQRKYPSGPDKQSEQILVLNEGSKVVLQLNKGQNGRTNITQQLNQPHTIITDSQRAYPLLFSKFKQNNQQKVNGDFIDKNTTNNHSSVATETAHTVYGNNGGAITQGYRQYEVIKERLKQYRPNAGSYQAKPKCQRETGSQRSGKGAQLPEAGGLQGWFTTWSVVQPKGATTLSLEISSQRPSLPPKVDVKEPRGPAYGSQQKITSKQIDTVANVQIQNVTLSQQLQQNPNGKSTDAQTDIPYHTLKVEINEEASIPVTTNTLQLSTKSTSNPYQAAHVQRRRVYPTYNHPMPTDPYSPNISNLLFTMGAHGDSHSLAFDLPEVFHLPRGDDVFPRYFVKNGGEQCFKDGTATATTNGEVKPGDAPAHHNGCLCKRGWHGRHCSIPEGVFSSTGARFVDLLKPRNISRRIISALAFNVEFELLEARLHELNDVVDVFIILESNSTNYGDPKPLLLLQRLREGYLREFHHKIIYLFRGKIPQGGREDGWIVDQHMRMFIGQEGMSRVFNSTPDDIFLYTDADELPHHEAILFLRIHDGYSEPIGVALRWSVFGFFWKQFEATRVIIGCTVGMFHYVFNNDAYQLRSTDYQTIAGSRLHSYVTSGAFIYDWYLGDNGVAAGWHCSWCLPPERIRTKLTSAINADFPRWGDFPEKLELGYLRSLIKTGTWFDDKSRFGMLVNWQSEELFAPKYVVNNYEKYKYLLDIDET